MLSQTSESPVSWHICELMWHMWLISVCKAKATPKHLKLRMIFLAFPCDPPLIRRWQNSIVHGEQYPQGHSRPWSLLLIWSLMADHIPWEKLTLLHTFFIPSTPYSFPPPNWQCSRNHPFFLCSSLEYHQQCGLLLPNKICVIGVTHNVPNPFQQFITLQT